MRKSTVLKDGKLTPVFSTKLGMLFHGDCLDIMPKIKSGTVHTVFADPPFNLGKSYGRRVNDQRADEEYVQWSQMWLDECIRVLAPGGALFLYNLPKWNVMLGAYLMSREMQFRHWIAVNVKSCLPIPGRLYPSHYSLLYYTKGEPRVFRKIRTPIETCRHCGGEIKDYGGHRQAMNPNGVNLMDVWSDVPPVRHKKFKSQSRTANALSTKIPGRSIEMSTNPGDLVLDPFGGSGTTYAVCEAKNRQWLGMELESVQPIIDRISGAEAIESHLSRDFVEG